jgi:hypothetical protein
MGLPAFAHDTGAEGDYICAVAHKKSEKTAL